MHNSMIPILAVVVFTGGLLWALLGQGGDLRGISGPALMPGVYPTTDKPLPMPADGDLVVRSVMTENSSVEGHDDSAPWDEVALVLENDSPITSAVAKAIAEALTGDRGALYTNRDPKRYFMVILVTKDEATIPLNVERVLRVNGPEFIPRGKPSTWSGSVSVELSDPVAAGPIEAVTYFPQSSVMPKSVSIEGSVENVASGVSWPQWYAGLGRSIADVALAELVNEQEAIYGNWGPLALRHGNWDERIPEPPRHSLIQWQSMWQYPAVRGWTGRIIGKVYYKRGIPGDSLESVMKLLARGGWEETDSPTEGLREFTHAAEDGTIRELSIADADFGYYVRMVQVHPNAIAGGGLDFESTHPGGQRLLRAHLGVGFSQKVEDRIRAALEQPMAPKP